MVIGGRKMSKYEVGDKATIKILGKSMTEYIVEDYNRKKIYFDTKSLDGISEPLSTYTEPLEAKIRRQAAEITRLLAENKELKEDKAMLNAKIDAYELYGDQHEEEYNQTFNQGAEAAWELASKVVLYGEDAYSGKELKEIFDCTHTQEIIRNNTYHEAAAKVAEWEKAKEEVKVGDEVEKNDLRDVRFIVTFTNGRLMSGVTQDGFVFANEKPKEWHKTGRHIDIDGFLKQIGEK